MTIFMGNCKHCGLKGHSQKYCPDLNPSGTPGVFHGKCNLCGIRGHKAEVCPNKSATRTVNGVDEEAQPQEEPNLGCGLVQGDWLMAVTTRNSWEPLDEKEETGVDAIVKKPQFVLYSKDDEINYH